MGIALLTAIGLITGGSAREPIDKVLAQIGRLLVANASKQDQFRMESVCHEYIGNLDLPKEFSVLNKKLWALYDKRDYFQCAEIADQMEKLLPRNFTDSLFGSNRVEVSTPGKTEKDRSRYMYSVDALIGWRNFVGDFRAMGNDYVGALKEYEAARKIKLPEGASTVFPISAYGISAYGQSQMYALLGLRAQSLKNIHEAPRYLSSWCGTCNTGMLSYVERLELVYSAAALPPTEAEAALIKLIRGQVKPPKTSSRDKYNHSEILGLKGEAIFMLGEVYLRQAKGALAQKAFRAVAAEKTSMNAKMAASRLRTMGALN